MLENKINLMQKNIDEMNYVIGFDNDTVSKKCGALSLTLRNMTIDFSMINDCIEIIKKNTSLFLNFKGFSMINCAIDLTFEASQDESFSEIMVIYKKLSKHFLGSNYLSLAAQIIYSANDRLSPDVAIANTKKAYNYLRKKSFLSTGSEELLTAVMIAVTSDNLLVTFDDIEQYNSIFEAKDFLPKEKIQALCHILSLFSGIPEDKCNKVIKLSNLLAENDIVFNNYALPLLATCAFISDDYDKFVNDMIEVNAVLKKQAGFGFLSNENSVDYIVVASLVASNYLDYMDERLVNIIENHDLNIILVMLLVVTVVTAAASNCPTIVS